MKEKKIKKLTNGFSLMETLIWVAIVGLFVGLITLSSVTLLSKAKVKAAKQEMTIYSAALLEYYQTEGSFPSDDEGLEILLEEDYVIAKGKKKLADPWGTAYVYSVLDDGEAFIIKSLGSDKREGGEKGTKKDIIVSSGNIEDDFADDIDDEADL